MHTGVPLRNFDSNRHRRLQHAVFKGVLSGTEGSVRSEGLGNLRVFAIASLFEMATISVRSGNKMAAASLGIELFAWDIATCHSLYDTWRRLRSESRSPWMWKGKIGQWPCGSVMKPHDVILEVTKSAGLSPP